MDDVLSAGSGRLYLGDIFVKTCTYMIHIFVLTFKYNIHKYCIHIFQNV